MRLEVGGQKLNKCPGFCKQRRQADIKNKIMKISILFVLLITSVSMYGQVDFSGSWRLNLDKTQFNGTPGTPAAARLLVEQKDGIIMLQRNDRAKEILKIDSTVSIEIAEEDNKTKV